MHCLICRLWQEQPKVGIKITAPCFETYFSWNIEFVQAINLLDVKSEVFFDNKLVRLQEFCNWQSLAWIKAFLLSPQYFYAMVLSNFPFYWQKSVSVRSFDVFAFANCYCVQVWKGFCKKNLLRKVTKCRGNSVFLPRVSGDNANQISPSKFGILLLNSIQGGSGSGSKESHRRKKHISIGVFN